MRHAITGLDYTGHSAATSINHPRPGRRRAIAASAIGAVVAACVSVAGCRTGDVADLDSMTVGESLMQSRQYEDALAWFDRALSEAPPTVDRAADSAAAARRAILRSGRGLALSRLRRRAEAVDAIRQVVADLEPLTAPDAERARALAQVALARVLNETGRSFDAVHPATLAVEWWSAVIPRTARHAEAECELGRALILTGQSADGRALLSECVAVYRAWDRADPEVVRALERLQ